MATALRNVGIKKPFKKVDISGQGGAFRKRSPSGRISNHTSGNAIDINHLNIEFFNGEKETFSVSPRNYDWNINPGFTRCTKNCNGKRWLLSGEKGFFFFHFKECLESSISETLAPHQANGKNCSGGVLDCNDRIKDDSHDNHIHLGFPVCPKPAKFRTI